MEDLLSDDLLFSACREGDVLKAKIALDLGANVNALRKVGEYVDNTDDDFKRKGRAYVTPLIMIATSAFGKSDTTPYKTIISMLLRNKKIDLEHVVFNEEDEYQHSVFGDYVCINKNMSYSGSLVSVLKTAVRDEKNGDNFLRNGRYDQTSLLGEGDSLSFVNTSFKRAADSFPISPKMADFIIKQLSIVLKQRNAFFKRLFDRKVSSK